MEFRISTETAEYHICQLFLIFGSRFRFLGTLLYSTVQWESSVRDVDVLVGSFSSYKP